MAVRSPPSVLKEMAEEVLLARRRRERLALFDDVGGENLSRTGAGVGRVVNRAGRKQESAAGLQCHRRLALLLNQKRALEHVTDLFAGMRMPSGRGARIEVGEGLDDFVAGGREVALLQDGPLEGGLLRGDGRGEGERRDGQSDASHERSVESEL